ncbi:hypothetical protein QVH35_06305 [Candidatus Nitrosotenuis chungbukensis]|uniref:hypothetical protein n=1 Tax=Candidatus Nitrosotenuis chungbukensis TaxID=1353246 RepID=UPI002673A84B|nr:hypothetical protein [Candidatus Nitrosotenuis chungbukensis]WKT57076.1 hypothetical protein QVH35_06305 [Candidatus Nitrosotenuis chungbukensis]
MAESDKISRSAWMTLAILSCLGLIAMYTETMILPAIPDFIKDFDITYITSSWILSSYLIAGAVATPIVGKLIRCVRQKENAPNSNGSVLVWSFGRRTCQ